MWARWENESKGIAKSWRKKTWTTLLVEMVLASFEGHRADSVFELSEQESVLVVANGNGCVARGRGWTWKLTFLRANLNRSECFQGTS